MADLQANGRGPELVAKVASTAQDYGGAQKHSALISGFHSGMATFLTNLGLWSMVYLTIPLVASGKIEGPMLATLALLTLASFEAVTPLPMAAQMWESMRAASRRLFEIVDSRPVVMENEITPDDSWTEHEENGQPVSIRFSDLTFQYPSQNSPAIEEISFKLEPGKSLAIVGPSGAGKSTIANLLLRFWEYSSGEVHLGQKPLRGLEGEQVRKRFAVVSQNSYFFNTSIRENLRLARPGASQREIEAATKQARIHDFISSLPDGYNTLIGEQGQRLSGGERQRLAIARALLKEAPILILDEPTANLDSITEKQVLETLFNVMKDRTSLIITHRLIGLEYVDEILVMEGGRIIERGDQAGLLSKDGLYRHLWELQYRIFAT
jgi:ABC-type multidrug transport system fused ATPase/permease subunit